MLIASAAGLLASSDPDSEYLLQTSVDGPQALLTSTAPKQRYLFSIHVNALGPENSDTTSFAHAQVQGTITAPDAPAGESPFVTVRTGNGTLPSGQQLQALTSFDTSNDVTFTGSCAKLDPALPCEAHFFVELERADGGTRGGTLSVAWSVQFNSSVSKTNGSDQSALAEPWTIEVSQQ